MDFLKYTSNIKAGLFLLGFFLIIFLLTYTQSIVNELRNDNGEIVKLYAEIIAETILMKKIQILILFSMKLFKKLSFQ